MTFAPLINTSQDADAGGAKYSNLFLQEFGGPQVS